VKQRARLGMALFLLNEAVLFFMLIAAFVYFRASSVATAARNLDLTTATLYTACLLASSFTMWRATLTGTRAWLAATLALGAIFLYGQSAEYWRLFHQNVTISGRTQFGTTFFALTGVHALHVFGGLLLLTVLVSGAGFRPAHRAAVVDAASLYWYFVDAIWILIFAVVYLWTFL